jgi:hypothetical protein
LLRSRGEISLIHGQIAHILKNVAFQFRIADLSSVRQRLLILSKSLGESSLCVKDLSEALFFRGHAVLIAGLLECDQGVSEELRCFGELPALLENIAKISQLPRHSLAVADAARDRQRFFEQGLRSIQVSLIEGQLRHGVQHTGRAGTVAGGRVDAARLLAGFVRSRGVPHVCQRAALHDAGGGDQEPGTRQNAFACRRVSRLRLQSIVR